MRTDYTRRIGADQRAGAAAYTVGVVGIQQRESSALGSRATNLSVVRLKRDVLKQGSVGLIFASRSQSVNASGSSQTLGADASFTFLQNLTVNAYLARTRTEGYSCNDASFGCESA